MAEPEIHRFDNGPMDQRGWYVLAENGDRWDELAGPFDTLADAEQWLHDHTEPDGEAA